MSRVPRPAKSYSNMRSNVSPSKPSVSPTTPKGTSRTLRVPSGSKSRPSSLSKPIEEPETPKLKLSVREQIALKREEAKKASLAQKKAGSGFSNSFDDIIDAIPDIEKKTIGEADALGRWGVRETIERARDTGNLNLSSRTLPCLPSCLFDIHLGVSAKPLEGVTEPNYPEETAAKRKQNRQQPSWFEAQDLTVLKARTNEIVAVQPELALFGSLKAIDFHSNRLKSLPDTLTILACLTTLDVSNNEFVDFPPALFSLPALATLNISHNKITHLPFSLFQCKIDIAGAIDTGAFFQPEVSRAVEPLPCLRVLEATHNQLNSANIEANFLPKNIRRLALSHNPLGSSSELVDALSSLSELQELHLDHTTVSPDSFKQPGTICFPQLSVLDVSETDLTEENMQLFFSNTPRAEGLTFEASTAAPQPGELRVSAGKKMVKEPWEIEAEKRFHNRRKPSAQTREKQPGVMDKADKENWELESEKGLIVEGGRRQARRGAAGIAPGKLVETTTTQAAKPTEPPKVVEKEQWEIEAEQGLLTEGGRRRARAQQAAKAEMQGEDASPSSPTRTSSIGAMSMFSSVYFTQNTQTLTLPPSQPPSRLHNRAFSMVSSPVKERSTEDLMVPAPTLPLDSIIEQDFSQTLNVLLLTNRRADPSFSFPPKHVLEAAIPVYGVLPRLTELCLDGCNLGDMVNVVYQSDSEGPSTSKKMSLLDIIADTFVTLSVLDLSYNSITSDGLDKKTIEKMLVPAGNGRKGLTTLRLRGNRLSSLEAFEQVAELFKRNQSVPNWRFEELDVRDNEISKLPPLMGLMPMDVCLVDGNTFRVPPRKIWEREGTKGLLSWLRGRLD